MLGASPLCLYADITLTVDTYAHLEIEDLREAVEKLSKNGRTDLTANAP